MPSPASDPAFPAVTLPAPPLLPSDLTERASNPLDREAIDNDLVKSALAAMSQEQALFLKELRSTLANEGNRVEAIANEVKAQGNVLSSRMDALEESVLKKITTLGSEAQTMAHAIDEHTSQIKEVLHLAGETYSMATTAARDIDRVRSHLGIPDELDAQETPEARTGTDEGDSERS